MKIAIITILTLALVAYFIFGCLFWLKTRYVTTLLLTRDLEKMRIINKDIYLSKRLMFIAKISDNHIIYYCNPFLYAIYPLYLLFGWTTLMYSYVFCDKQTSEFVNESTNIADVRDVFGKSANIFREMDSRNEFETFKVDLRSFSRDNSRHSSDG
jgi:hypothetical protein